MVMLHFAALFRKHIRVRRERKRNTTVKLSLVRSNHGRFFVNMIIVVRHAQRELHAKDRPLSFSLLTAIVP